jgi:TM2 domain-containing membrane protein YozV
LILPAHTGERRSVSAHLAFLYSLAMPGVGEFYAGSRLLGAACFAALLALSAWTTVLCKRALEFVLYGKQAVFVWSDLFALYGLYALWLWSMFAAVQRAAARRRWEGEPPQTSVVWAGFFSWLSPGAAQAYQGKTGLGLALFAFFLIGTGLEIPFYLTVLEALKPALKSVSLANTHALIGLLGEISIRLKLNLASVLKDWAIYGSVFLAVVDLQSNWRRDVVEDRSPNFTFSNANGAVRSRPAKRPPFPRSTEGRALGLAFLSWICPGSAHLLLGQTSVAWSAIAIYAGSNALISGLLTIGIVTPATADLLTWGPMMLGIAVLIHAVILVVSKPDRIPPA